MFNNLNSLYVLARKKSEKTPEYILKLSELMRYMLYETSEKKVSLSKELDYIENYIELQKLRYGDKTNIKCGIQGRELADELYIAPFLLIPFVENSFKYGGGVGNNQSFILLNIVVEDRKLQFELKNDISHDKPTCQEKKGGFGIINVKERLKKLYFSKYSLIIEDENKQFNVFLKIELNNEK